MHYGYLYSLYRSIFMHHDVAEYPFKTKLFKYIFFYSISNWKTYTVTSVLALNLCNQISHVCAPHVDSLEPARYTDHPTYTDHLQSCSLNTTLPL